MSSSRGSRRATQNRAFTSKTNGSRRFSEPKQWAGERWGYNLRLKDKKTQEEYRKFIQGKMDDVLQKYHRRLEESEAETKHRVEAQENVLILFRKLREGISSIGRRDCFALEVYETSLFLAIIFGSLRHASAIIPHLFSHLYLTCQTPHENAAVLAALVSSMHYLLANYPSQGPFHQHLDSIHHRLLPKDSKERKWLTSLAAYLRNRQYASFERKSQKSAILHVLERKEQNTEDLGLLAVFTAVDGLRAKARETTWTVMRSAYRELACHAGSADTRDWLERSLCLRSIISEASTIALERFLEQQSSLGAVRARQGIEGRWIVCKIRS
ncbi:hypothetical protein APHAL10511_002736 [Amanita phalloides]|nr:hypothetical protein APHAL10511_002736 [Amanita phalloides]